MNLVHRGPRSPMWRSSWRGCVLRMCGKDGKTHLGGRMLHEYRHTLTYGPFSCSFLASCDRHFLLVSRWFSGWWLRRAALASLGTAGCPGELRCHPELASLPWCLNASLLQLVPCQTMSRPPASGPWVIIPHCCRPTQQLRLSMEVAGTED